MSIFCGWCMLLYNKILVRKAEKKTAECIRGKFYYIVPEEEYIKSHNGEEKK